jgi:hypothetical protein
MGLRLVLTGLCAAALALAAACADSTDDATGPPAPSGTPAATPTPTQPPDAAGGGAGEATVIPITPFPSPSPAPADWATYSDPGGRFTVRYPASWFANDGILSTFKIGEVGSTFPPDSTKVDVSVAPVNILSYCEPPGASAATLGGISGWQGVTLFGDRPDGLTRIHGMSVIDQGYCFHVAAYFYQENPDEATFMQIVDSFRFTD